MLFHLTMKHTEDNCPVYHRELQAEALAVSDRLEEISKELGVKVHFLVTNGPDHVVFGLLEADSLSAITRWVFSYPTPQDTKVVPVEHLGDAVALGKAMLEQAQAAK
jgi:hypothetical protein